MNLEIIGVAGTIALIASTFFGAYLAGRRSAREDATRRVADAEEVADNWRSNAEAFKTSAERSNAILVEKDLIIAGMSERLGRLDGVVQELGGQKVYQAMIDQQEKNLALFQEITHAIQEGDHQITAAIRDLSRTVEKATNGERKEHK